ncbi:MAG: PaaI family thioesterase [Candidatus Aminicenantes bacterium]|nr:PaaI family thioesterase [Candidatus Aminicenantes bacterium]
MVQTEWNDDHFCFACGEHNMEGLRIKFEYPEPGRCRAVFLPERRFQGWKDILHGGIISTLLDEALAHAYGGKTRGAGEAAVTAELTVKFKKPIKIGVPVYLEGRVVSVSGRVIEGESTLCDESGTVLASATGKLIKPKKI